MLTNFMDRTLQKSKWSKYRKWVFISLGGLVVVISIVFIAGKHVSRLNINTDTIVLDTIKMDDFDEFIPVDGTIQPLKTILINAAEGGTVAERYVDEGSIVSKGEPILRLSNNDLQLEFMNKESLLLDQMNNMRNTRISLEQNYQNLQQQILDAEHSYVDDKKVFERNKTIYKEKAISTADFEKSEDQYQYDLKKKRLLDKKLKTDSVFNANQALQLESGIRLIQQNLEMVKLSLENLTIKAPSAGQLTSLNAEIGDNKQKGQNIGQIDVKQGYKIVSNVDEHYVSRISKGLTGSFSLNEKNYNVLVTKVLPQVSGGQFKVELAFKDTVPEGIKEGQTLQIRLTLSHSGKALVVKNGGFYSKTGGNWIYVLDHGNAVKRTIKLGRQNPDDFEILQGLKPGNVVLVSSYETFGDADELVLNKK